MAFLDLPESDLASYAGSTVEPRDFDGFWADTLAQARTHDGAAEVQKIDSDLTSLDVYDVRFPGWNGEPVSAWLRLPHGATTPLPAVVEYVGYGGGRGYAEENLYWASCGFAHLQMDTRGQGATWATGDTPDSGVGGSEHPGFMTRGIGSPETYYFRRLITDAVRAVDATRRLPWVDANAIHVHGRSQGGGLALAVAGLTDGLASATPLVPFLCDFPRAITITDATPFRELANYVKARREDGDLVLRTLGYFDGVHFARRAKAPAHFSTALMDEVCPPSTVYAAFNAYSGPKDIQVWRFNGHEGGGQLDLRDSLRHIRAATPQACAPAMGVATLTTSPLAKRFDSSM